MQLQLRIWMITTNWYNLCNYVEGMETDLYDMIGSNQCADLIPKISVSKMERD
jgi:hypothetical protein